MTTTEERIGWTVAQLDWIPWVPTVYESNYPPKFIAEVEERTPVAKKSVYFATLAHDLPVLEQRMLIFNASLRSEGGATSAERELAAVAASRVNGCVYCASVHARAFNSLSNKPEVIDAIYAEGVDAPLNDPRLAAIVAFSAKLTDDHGNLTAADLKPLRDAGLSDLEILDVTHAAAMFGWANRLMLTLGEPASPSKE
jgi:uncharacterized peroxidase-related enzyme